MRVLTTGLTITGVLLAGLTPAQATKTAASNPATVAAPQSTSTRVLSKAANLAAFKAAPRGQQEASRFFWANRDAKAPYFAAKTPEDRALAYLRHYATGLGLSPSTLNGAQIKAVHHLAGGSELVQFSQR